MSGPSAVTRDGSVPSAASSQGRTRAMEYRRRLGRTFLEDGRVMLEGLKDAIAQLGGESSDSGAPVDQAFRYAHSLKSEASFLGLTPLFERAHALEEYLALVRDADLERIGGVATLVAAAKEVQNAFEEAERTVREQSHTPELSAGDGRRHNAGPVEPRPGGLHRLSRFERRVLREAEEHGERLYRIRCEIVDPEPMLYARIYLVVGNLERIVNVVKTNPPVEEVTDALRSFEILCTSEVDPEVIASAIDVAAIENVRVEERSYEVLYAAADEEDDGYTSGFSAGIRRVDLSLPTRKYERVCLYTDELRHELDLVYHAVSNDKRLQGTALQRRLQTASRMAAVVERAVSETAIVRLYGVFDELQALVAQLGRELGKLIRIRTSGGELGVFLPLARILSEVLAHLVRNAADHAIESPEERAASGKSEYGEIRVTAQLEGQSLVIRVQDDGRGLDEDWARERYRKLFLTEPPETLLATLATPGFTTRDEGSDHSGRGVGLDTVVHAVETVLGGTVKLATHAGDIGNGDHNDRAGEAAHRRKDRFGVTFELHLSRGTRLVSVLVARFGDQVFAIPASEIVETVRIDPRYLSHDHHGNTYYRLNAEVLALYSVAPVERLEQLDGSRLYGVVTLLRDRRVVILVEDLISEETVARDEQRHDHVYSQTLERSVRLIVPLQLRV